MRYKILHLFRVGVIGVLSAVLLSGLSGCGGSSGSSGASGTSSSAGSGDGPASSASPASAASTPEPAMPASVVQSTTPNVQPISIGPVVSGSRNILQTSVTICVPGTDTCQTIDKIQVDTGSQGLRILASAISPAIALPIVTVAGSSSGSNPGNGASGSGASAVAASCTVFGTGYTWGAVRSADIRMAGQVANATSIQVIADPGVPAASSDCAKSGLPMLTASSLRSNGILGVGPFNADCGSGCASSALSRWYYACTSGACVSTSLPLAQQVTNPVSRFATDNNGVVIELPAVPDVGASSVSGTMTFGIGSQANNLLGNATVLKGGASTGYVTTNYDGQTYSASFIDSGSNGLFFPSTSTSLPRCGVWFCPPAPQTLSARISSGTAAAIDVTFSVSMATSLFASGNSALANLAGPVSGYFDWGLPFFFGRRVFTALEGRVTPSGNGPYYAF